jgi:hypothetical protein
MPIRNKEREKREKKIEDIYIYLRDDKAYSSIYISSVLLPSIATQN